MHRSQDSGRRRESSWGLVLLWLLVCVVMLSLVGLLLILAGYDKMIMQSLNTVVGGEDVATTIGEPNLPESNADHGDTLRDVMWGIRNEETEFLVIFDGTEKTLEYTNGSNHEVVIEVNKDLILGEGSILLHNHPIAEASFSLTDFGTFAKWQVEEAVVVTSTRTFRLTAPNGWPTAEEIDGFLDENWKKDFGSMEQEGLTGSVIETNEDGESERFWYSKSPLIERIAEEFGLVYTVERAEVVNGCIDNLGPF